MSKVGYVYIVTNTRNGTLYIGVTSKLVQRIWQHRNGEIAGFAKKYGCKMLVYFEIHESIEQAISREKAMKEWKRAWKIRRVEEQNPAWRDLWEDIAKP